MRKISEEKRVEIIKDYEAGVPGTVSAKKLKVSLSTVYSVRKLYNAFGEGRALNPNRVDSLRAGIASGAKGHGVMDEGYRTLCRNLMDVLDLNDRLRAQLRKNNIVPDA